jgi:hypothetical protein
VWLKRQYANMQYLLMQNKIVKHVVEKDVEKRIPSPTGSVMIGLNRHKSLEHRVKYVQN